MELIKEAAARRGTRGGGGGGRGEDGLFIATGNVLLKVYNTVPTHVPAAEMTMAVYLMWLKTAPLSSLFILLIVVLHGNGDNVLEIWLIDQGGRRNETLCGANTDAFVTGRDDLLLLPASRVFSERFSFSLIYIFGVSSQFVAYLSLAQQP